MFSSEQSDKWFEFRQNLRVIVSEHNKSFFIDRCVDRWIDKYRYRQIKTDKDR